jgi:hypothetical protein
MADARLPDIYRGDSYPVDVALAVDGVPEDLTGAYLLFLLTEVPSPDAPEPAVALQVRYEVPSGALAEAGGARINVTSQDTAALALGNYQMTLKRVRPVPANPDDVWSFWQQKLRVRYAPAETV